MDLVGDMLRNGEAEFDVLVDTLGVADERAHDVLGVAEVEGTKVNYATNAATYAGSRTHPAVRTERRGPVTTYLSGAAREQLRAAQSQLDRARLGDHAVDRGRCCWSGRRESNPHRQFWKIVLAVLICPDRLASSGVVVPDHDRC